MADEKSNQAYDAVVQQGLTEGIGEGKEKVVFSEYRHPPFGEEVRAVLEQLRAVLGEVYPLSIEQWEDGFRRDANPEREIALWLHLADTYQRLVTQVFKGPGPEHRAGIFRVLLAAASSEEEAAAAAEAMGMPQPFVDRIFQELQGPEDDAEN